MTIFGSSQRVNPGNLGMRLFQSAGIVLPWWNPDGATPGGVGGSCVGAYQAISMPSYAASKVNLANPGTNDLVEGNGAVPWAGGIGWGFVQAAAQYFDTGLIPASDQSWSMLIQYSNTVGVNLWICGCLSAGGGARIFGYQPIRIANFVGYANGGIRSVAPLLASGNLGMGGNLGYRNGIADGAPIGGWGGPANQPIYIGCLNNAGAAGTFTTSDVESIAIYDVTLTAPEAAAREARMVIL